MDSDVQDSVSGIQDSGIQKVHYNVKKFDFWGNETFPSLPSSYFSE
jgi:hypothetical protein